MWVCTLCVCACMQGYAHESDPMHAPLCTQDGEKMPVQFASACIRLALLLTLSMLSVYHTIPCTPFLFGVSVTCACMCVCHNMGAEEKLDPGKEPLPGLNRPRSNRGTKTTSFQGVDGVVAKVAYNGNDNDATIPLSPRTGRAVSFSADVAPAIVPALSQLERMEQGQAQSVTSPRGGALSRPGAIPAVSNTDQDAVITL